MNIISGFSLRGKLTILMGLSAVAVVATILLGANSLHRRMYDDRIDKLRAVVHGARSFAAGLEAQVSAGKMTRDQAMAALAAYGHSMRFDHGDGYLSVSTLDGITRIHGTDPSRENKPSTAAASADGKTVPQLVAEVLAGGADDGIISYDFAKPGQTVPVPKVSYVARFAPWQMYMLAGAYTDDLEAEFHVKLLNQLLVGGGILAVILVLTWLVSRDISGTLEGLGASMKRLAGGDTTGTIPGLDQAGELGAMAASVRVFQDSMAEADRLRAARDGEKQRAEDERREAVAALAARFEASVGGIVESVAHAAAEFQNAARTMAATTEETTRRTSTVASASEDASQNVQTVASAAEELSASIREISQQVGQASTFIEEGVRQTVHSNEQVKGLASTAEKISDVVKIISEIAGQTNLLALNATIEAARAGEAGKGFAVVASEVKALATQTAKATEEIAAQIKSIQDATRITAGSIQGVTETISKVNETAAAIAAAVEEQGAATQEISRNVLRAAQGTQDVSGNIANVNEAAQRTGTEAARVLASAEELSKSGDALRKGVAGFLQEMRAA